MNSFGEGKVTGQINSELPDKSSREGWTKKRVNHRARFLDRGYNLIEKGQKKG